MSRNYIYIPKCLRVFLRDNIVDKSFIKVNHDGTLYRNTKDTISTIMNNHGDKIKNSKTKNIIKKNNEEDKETT